MAGTASSILRCWRRRCSRRWLRLRRDRLPVRGGWRLNQNCTVTAFACRLGAIGGNSLFRNIIIRITAGAYHLHFVLLGIGRFTKMPIRRPFLSSPSSLFSLYRNAAIFDASLWTVPVLLPTQPILFIFYINFRWLKFFLNVLKQVMRTTNPFAQKRDIRAIGVSICPPPLTCMFYATACRYDRND